MNETAFVGLEIPVLVAELPPLVIMHLAIGPRRGDGCRVCDALDHWMHGSYGQGDCAANKLIDWHAGYDFIADLDDLGKGERCYQRCLAIYRAAEEHVRALVHPAPVWRPL